MDLFSNEFTRMQYSIWAYNGIVSLSSVGSCIQRATQWITDTAWIFHVHSQQSYFLYMIEKVNVYCIYVRKKGLKFLSYGSKNIRYSNNGFRR
jgi:hypothetical protein